MSTYKFDFTAQTTVHYVGRDGKQRYGHAQHSAVRLNKLRPSVHLRSVAENCDRILEFFHILARYFHETRGSLNLLTVHSCSQNLPMISCMYA